MEEVTVHLTAVRVRACVGHAELARLGMAELEVLIRKLVSVDGFTASAITLSEISTLERHNPNHKCRVKHDIEEMRTWSMKS